MAKQTRVRDYDQFIVRLPPGMRDRIKAKADRAGMSMNEAIVWCLEQHFPAPATLADRINELADKVAVLKSGNDLEPAVDEIIDQIASTLSEVSLGKVKASKAFRDRVERRVYEWEMDYAESNSDPFDDENWGGGGFVPEGDAADPGFPHDDPKEKS